MHNKLPSATFLMIDLSVLYNDPSKPKAFYNTIYKSTYTNRHIPAVIVADNRSSAIPCSADYTTPSHAAGVGGRATPCGKENHDQHKYFVAINAASPYEFDSKHSDHKLEGKYRCYFEAKNNKVYFPVILVIGNAVTSGIKPLSKLVREIGFGEVEEFEIIDKLPCIELMLCPIRGRVRQVGKRQLDENEVFRITSQKLLI